MADTAALSPQKLGGKPEARPAKKKDASMRATSASMEYTVAPLLPVCIIFSRLDPNAVTQ